MPLISRTTKAVTPTYYYLCHSSYWVFRSWGRVGTTIGGNKLEKCGHSKSSAIDLFRDLYLEKTGNDWDDRKNFVKQPKKFFPLDIDYGGVSVLHCKGECNLL